ncbi:MAG: alpha-N-acetylglucosaminidase TIM-barrel domain-containing protein, partial [Actinocatenispora sp.]
ALAAPAERGGAFDTGPAAQALHRLIGGRAEQVTLRAVDPGTGQDHFSIAAERHRLVVTGTSPAVLLTGFGWYLKYVAHANIALEGEQLHLPARLPLPAAPIAHTSSVAHRFALNDTNEGYAGPYLSWSAWQHRIDVLALRGINEVLLYEGQEAVYERTFQRFGYSAAEMRGWIPQPGHQSWWLLQNICCVASPVSQQLIDQHAALGRRIADRLRSLGMTPVLPGYYGTVPPNFADRNPGASTVPQGTWDGLPRPDWLDPTNPAFAQVAAEFYRVQSQLFGDSTMYKMDLLHEGGKAGDVDVPAASRAVQKALNDAHPDAIWAILGWQHNPLPETLHAVDRSKMLVLDGISESPSITDRDADFFGTPYAFGTIWNFGGHQNLGASLTDWNRKFHAWRAKTDTALNGIALMPEAIDNNPAAVEFFTELPWQDGPVDMGRWFDDYATARYGAADPHALAAWRVLAGTVYDWPPTVDTKHPTALYDNQPSLTTTSSALPYDIGTFDAALGDLLAVDPRLRGSTAYRYDLVDVARQVLANHSRTALPAISAAYHDKDLATFQRLTGQWMSGLRLMDTLLGTDDNLLFGAWQAEAERQAAGRDERRALRYDVRALVSLWADGTTLQDYARREFNGLVGDYYGGRWQRYFDSLTTALKTGRPPADIDWAAVADHWARADTRYPATAHGSAYQAASRVALIPAGGLSLDTVRRGVEPGGSTELTATFTNHNLLRATDRLSLSLSAPDGYRVRASTPTSARTVPAAGTFTATWTVTAPAGAEPGTVPELSAAARWSSGHSTDLASARTTMLVTGGDPGGFRTYTNSDASFAVSGDGYGIAGGGADLWKDTAEYGALYRPDVLGADRSVTTTVRREDAASGYARAGLIASADLSAPGGAGSVSIAVTPAHGCMFSWDSDGDGTFDRYTRADGFGAEVVVRLGRTGDHVTGGCSSDGRNWTLVGDAALPGTDAAEDVGMVFSAVNAHDGRAGLATFHGFDVAPYTERDASSDTLRSLNQPVTALNAEAGHPAAAADDGNRANSPYWGGPLAGDGTWWQVDLGAETTVSSVNVRNYVDGTRYYTWRLLGSLDGEHWYTLGGRFDTSPVTDAGETFHTDARARYVRVVGLSNTANATFHLTEVSVYGSPA